MKSMAATRQYCLHLLLALSLIFAPMTPVLAVHAISQQIPMSHGSTVMDHGSMHHDMASADQQNHCHNKNKQDQDSKCLHSCCGDCFSSFTFLGFSQSSVLFASHTPPFIDTLRISQTTFPHYRPPA